MVKEKCPRCGGETIELGTPVIKVGKTREMRVSVRKMQKLHADILRGNDGVLRCWKEHKAYL